MKSRVETLFEKELENQTHKRSKNIESSVRYRNRIDVPTKSQLLKKNIDFEDKFGNRIVIDSKNSNDKNEIIYNFLNNIDQNSQILYIIYKNKENRYFDSNDKILLNNKEGEYVCTVTIDEISTYINRGVSVVIPYNITK